jgi:hypothetical protein
MDPRAIPRSGSSVRTRLGKHLGPIARERMAPSSVVMNFVNLGETPLSAELITDTDPMPTGGSDPAIPGARTKDVTQGLPQGGNDVMRFTAPPRGSFRITCGVPGPERPECGSGSRWTRRRSRRAG